MENYLKREDSAFYHITSPYKWESINKEGRFKSQDGKVFVLRSCDERIICSLAIGQLTDTYTQND